MLIRFSLVIASSKTDLDEIYINTNILYLFTGAICEQPI